MHKVIIVGGGAAGMFAAVTAASRGCDVTLLEKNEKLGKKIYITGKGRCNLCNDVNADDYIKNVVSNPRFLYSSINTFSPEDTQKFFSEHGLRLKIERGGRVFPYSDKASDVTRTLEKVLRENGVKILLNTPVKSLIIESGVIRGAIIGDGTEIKSDSVIVCTGGISYPLTGSTGDGYAFARAAGHSIIPLRPALTGIELRGDSFFPLQGLSLKNVMAFVYDGDKKIFEKFGEMLFTHYGVSGPIILSCSSIINRTDVARLTLCIDLKPALDEKTLDSRLVREFTANSGKHITAVMRTLVPHSLGKPLLNAAGISESTNCSEITREQRLKLVYTLKHFTFKIKGLRPIEEGIVTAGGVCVKEVNPKTMESRLVKGLFFAGEVLDIDCFTGGFNLQAAFSTGCLAGLNA